MCPAFRRLVTVAILLAAVAATAPAEPQPDALDEPVMPEPFVMSPFSNSRTIALLGELLSKSEFSKDPLLRERAIFDLGRTMNYRAVPLLVKNTKDPDWRVRVAAVHGMGQLPLFWVADALIDALSAEDNRVAAEAVRCVVRQDHTAAAGAVGALIARGEPRLTALAIDALTHLGKARDQAELMRDLTHEAVSVRLAAMRNVMLLKELDAALLEKMTQLATGKTVDAIMRARAILVLGKVKGVAVKDILLSAAADPDWRVRASAARMLRRLGRHAKIIELLSDPAGPVRLAACQTVQHVRDPAAFEALWRMLDDPVEATYLAAREALVHIGEPEVAVRAGQRLRDNAQHLLDLGLPRRIWRRKYPEQEVILGGTDADRVARRRVIDASYMLGKLKSREAYQFHLSLLKDLCECDGVLGQVALSVGEIGEPKAVPAILDYLDHGLVSAREFYSTGGGPLGPTVCFNEGVYADVIRGLGVIDPAAGTEQIRKTTFMFAGGMRMQQAVVAVTEVLDDRHDKFSDADLDKMLSTIIVDLHYRKDAIWNAAHTVGKLRFKGPACAKSLNEMLNVDRRSREFMIVAAWAIQETTGKSPRLPEPVVRDPHSMTMRDIRRD